MLMIERRGEHYLVHFLQTDDRFSGFALPSQSFPDMQSLTGFLLHVLQVPQRSVAQFIGLCSSLKWSRRLSEKEPVYQSTVAVRQMKVDNEASITASATFGHSASPDNVACWYIMALPCALKIYVKYFYNFLSPEPVAFQSLTKVFLFQ
jgi:hypothetical protein